MTIVMLFCWLFLASHSTGRHYGHQGNYEGLYYNEHRLVDLSHNKFHAVQLSGYGPDKQDLVAVTQLPPPTIEKI